MQVSALDWRTASDTESTTSSEGFSLISITTLVLPEEAHLPAEEPTSSASTGTISDTYSHEGGLEALARTGSWSWDRGLAQRMREREEPQERVMDMVEACMDYLAEDRFPDYAERKKIGGALCFLGMLYARSPEVRHTGTYWAWWMARRFAFFIDDPFRRKRDALFGVLMLGKWEWYSECVGHLSIDEAVRFSEHFQRALQWDATNPLYATMSYTSGCPRAAELLIRPLDTRLHQYRGHPLFPLVHESYTHSLLFPSTYDVTMESRRYGLLFDDVFIQSLETPLGRALSLSLSDAQIVD